MKALSWPLLWVLLAASCQLGGESGGDATIPGELFIATYVDLRLEALEIPSSPLSAEEREAILQRHGVTEAQLLAFVEVHGQQGQFMSEVWSEVEERLERETAESPVGEATEIRERADRS